ncbi:MAG: glycosyltransferase [Verrucomicrobia bacterium]|nr:glycosyltransferase [Verrucomicrobiota bacterium]
MRTRLTFLIRDLGYGGAQRQLVALATGLPSDEFAISILHYYTGPLEEELRAAGIKTLCVGKKSRWDLIGFFIRLVRAARAENPHILHSYLTESNVMSVLLQPFLRSVHIVWGLRDSQSDSHLWGLLGRLSFRLSCLLSHFADRIIANSEAGRAYYISQGFPAEKLSVIPNGINVDLFAPDSSAGSRLRKEWQIANDSFLFGHVGRLNAMKDHATLLRAFAIVAREHSSAHLVCVGGGDENYAAEIKQLAAELNITEKISWLQSRPNMTAVYNAFDALVSSSSFGEGFSNVVAEAMACGVPCVITNVGDSVQIVADTGLSVPPSQSAALAAAMDRLMVADAATMAELKSRARSRIVENFSMPQLIRRTRDSLLHLRSAEKSVSLRACLNSNA